MKRDGIIIVLIAAVFAAGVFLAVLAPDGLSLVFVLFMLALVTAGILAGHRTWLRYTRAFDKADANIEGALGVASEDPWLVVRENRELFGMSALDGRFQQFVTRRGSGRGDGKAAHFCDLRTYITDRFLMISAHEQVLAQIPGTLTGLGILGTFLGLLLGLQKLGFSSATSTVESIQTLLGGVRLAFYTSIAGIILSILFNLLTGAVKNRMLIAKEQFFQDFYHYILPDPDEEMRNQEVEFEEKILRALDGTRN